MDVGFWRIENRENTIFALFKTTINIMKKVLFALTILAGTLVSAQETSSEKFQIGLQYNQFFDKQDAVSLNYNGIIGLNTRYKVVFFGVADLNAGLTLSYFQTRDLKDLYPYKDAININPNIVAEFNTNSGFKPFVGIGYNFFNSKWKINYSDLTIYDPNDPLFESGTHSEKVRLSGFNINLGARYHFEKWFYIELSYNFMSIKTSGDNFGLWAIDEYRSWNDFSYYNTEKNANLHLFNIGVGVRF